MRNALKNIVTPCSFRRWRAFSSVFPVSFSLKSQHGGAWAELSFSCGNLLCASHLSSPRSLEQMKQKNLAHLVHSTVLQSSPSFMKESWLLDISHFWFGQTHSTDLVSIWGWCKRNNHGAMGHLHDDVIWLRLPPCDRSLPAQPISIPKAQSRTKPTNLCAPRVTFDNHKYSYFDYRINKPFTCSRCKICVSCSVHVISTYYTRKGS